MTAARQQNSELREELVERDFVIRRQAARIEVLEWQISGVSA